MSSRWGKPACPAEQSVGECTTVIPNLRATSMTLFMRGIIVAARPHQVVHQ